MAGLGFHAMQGQGDTDALDMIVGKTVSAAYVLEYGVDKIEMHVDAVKPGQKVVLIDDLVATGGTAAAGTCCHSAAADGSPPAARRVVDS